jgi:hypothetical protein
VAIRSSGGTNFELPRSEVSRTKSKTDCFAGPSFHEGRAPLEPPVCAEAGAVNKVPDKAGSTANAESTTRRSMAEYGVSFGMFRSPLVGDGRLNRSEFNVPRQVLTSASARGYAKSTLADVRFGSKADAGPYLRLRLLWAKLRRMVPETGKILAVCSLARLSRWTGPIRSQVVRVISIE